MQYRASGLTLTRQSATLALPSNLHLLFLPPCSPELNPQEHIWDELREKFFHNQIFDNLKTLEDIFLKRCKYSKPICHE
ncbi:transposase [Nitrosomonas sp. Nm166]|uniref:transposase n=1 Tax=Nitrosomonas sp. Nm166 TaxID=1881054 RepID=UPI000B89394B